jgi:hypothetical protein
VRFCRVGFGGKGEVRERRIETEIRQLRDARRDFDGFIRLHAQRPHAGVDF